MDMPTGDYCYRDTGLRLEHVGQVADAQAVATGTGTGPRTATFEARPCLCCKGHTPIPLQVELHHIWPQYDQIALYGALRNKTLVPLCRTAHRNLHIYLTALMAGQEPPHVNAYTARLAREGLRLITEAHDAAGVPIPPGGGGE